MQKYPEKIKDAITKSAHQTILFVSYRTYLDKFADQVIVL